VPAPTFFPDVVTSAEFDDVCVDQDAAANGNGFGAAL